MPPAERVSRPGSGVGYPVKTLVLVHAPDGLDRVLRRLRQIQAAKISWAQGLALSTHVISLSEGKDVTLQSTALLTSLAHRIHPSKLCSTHFTTPP